jgi:HSP20 family protein
MREPSPFYSYINAFLQDFQSTVDASPWRPFIDIYERPHAILVVVELPGVRKEDLSLSVDRGVLAVAGYRHKETPAGVQHVHQMEIPHGPFKRTIQLHSSADVQNIKAEFKDGFLSIEIPRKGSHE